MLVVGAKSTSLLGDEVAAVALVLRLQSHGAGPGAVAALLTATMLPMLLLAGVVGRLVDRYDSRRLLVTSSVAQGAVCTGLAFVDSATAVLMLVAALGAGQAVNGGTWQALLPAIAGKDGLPRAVGLSQAGTTAAGIAAPAIGGLLTGVYGARVPLLVDAVTFLAVTAAGLLITTRRAAAPAQPGVRLHGGLHLVRTDPLLRMLLLLLGLFVTIGAMVNVVEVFLVRETLHASTTWYGIVGASFGVGLLAGSLAGGRLGGDRQLARAFVAAAAGLSLAIASMAAAPTVLWLLPASFAVGFANAVLNVALGSLVMGHAAPEQRGRVGAVLNGVASGTQLGAYALGATLAVALTPRQIFAVAGMCGLLAPAVLGRALIRAAGADTGGDADAALPYPAVAAVASQAANASKE